MYKPQLNPGEEILRISPDVIVKNASFDAVLTNKRIIFAKKTDDIYEKKELVFPLNLVRKFDPKADQAGTPTIEFSIQKPAGDLGDLILRFSQTGDYRYSERDDWIEKLKRVVPPEPDMRSEQDFQPQQSTSQTPPYAQHGDIPGRNQGFDRVPVAPPVPQGYDRTQYNTVPPGQETFAQAPGQRMGPQQPGEQARYPPQGMPPVMPHKERRPPPPLERTPIPPPANQGNSSFCRFCGANVPAGSMFCPSCGQRAEAAPPVQQAYARPPMPPSNQRPPVPSDPYAQRKPPAPPYNAQTGGFSLENDPEFRSMHRRAGVKTAKQSRPPSPGKAQKDQQKAFRLAEKQRAKDAKLAEKEHKKAMKRSGSGNYDPYGYKESRLPEGLPKIIGIVLAVVVVIAVAAYAVNSGMLAGSGTPVTSGTDATVSPTTATDYTPGTTTVSESFGTWNIQIIYSGKWSGSYTVNGVKTTIKDADGETDMYGYKQITLENPSGTIEATITKEESGTGVLMVDIINQKGNYAASESTSDAYETVTVSAAVS